MSELCTKCSYPITEPLCSSCVIDEIKIWLYDQRVKKDAARKINQELNFLLHQIEALDYVFFPSRSIWKISKINCVKCKKDMHLMCFYCVTNQAAWIIKENLRNEESLENFQESFNTEMHDYELNAEENSMRRMHKHNHRRN